MYLGVEIGGTKLQLGVGTGDGSVPVALERLDVDPRRGADGICEQIERAGRDLCRRFSVERIGIGFGGPVRGDEGRVITSHQVAGWDDFPLADWCRSTLGLPAVVGNDCDAAALAEARFGAGRGERSVFYVTVGTGVGGGLVIDGHLYGTHRPAVAEIGHLRPGLTADRPDETVESLASGRGIEAAARRRIAETDSADTADLLTRCGDDPQRLTARQVAEAAAAGNRLAQDVLHGGCTALGWAIAQVVTLLAPEVVVVGGGVSLMGEELFFVPLREQVRRYVFPPLADACRVVPSELGELVVVHGALALAAGDR